MGKEEGRGGWGEGLLSQVVTLPHMASSITLANQAASRSEGALIARHLKTADVRGTIRIETKDRTIACVIHLGEGGTRIARTLGCENVTFLDKYARMTGKGVDFQSELETDRQTDRVGGKFPRETDRKKERERSFPET